MKARTYLGIDPGVSGGIAWISAAGDKYNAIKMPPTTQDILDNFAALTLNGTHPTMACIEKVNAGVFGRPGAKMGVVSAFTFGRSVERLHSSLIAARIPFDEVLPVKWQTVMQCRSGGNKVVTKRRAQQLFPDIKVTHATADALLIAEFCRRLHHGPGPAASPGQREMFDGKENEEHKEEDGAEGEDILDTLSKWLAAGQRAQRAAQRTARLATGNGRPGHRGD